jgi:ABC-type polysaccharide/polyol phosphate transport system ATPase subunit
MAFVRRFCNRALWLHRGSPVALGPAGEVVDAFEYHLAEAEMGRISEPAPLELAEARSG